MFVQVRCCIDRNAEVARLEMYGALKVIKQAAKCTCCGKSYKNDLSLELELIFFEPFTASQCNSTLGLLCPHHLSQSRSLDSPRTAATDVEEPGIAVR